jgi:hypothetical protein
MIDGVEIHGQVSTVAQSTAVDMLKTSVSGSLRDYLLEHLPLIRNRCSEIDLSLSVMAIDRLLELLNDEKTTHDVFRTVSHEIQQRVRDELSLRLILYIPSNRTSFYEFSLRGWEPVIERFRCNFDIEEAGKCLGVGRFTAAVFHLARATESAVLELQCFLGDSDPKAHFGGVLSRLEALAQRTEFRNVPDNLKPYRKFLMDILPQLHAVKDSWRNKVAHVDRIVPIDVFTEEMALGVHSATRLLMRKLAEGLPETIPNAVPD